ncbi:hypothetical protein TeGR_g2803 [Tetraparma gracilis]|uniref:Methyltransferase small domain-containing protein n=1 Tax=Tetraparma gracilis TaxID=2962635 RepID=A0ABQ6M595_9STRA|nr:hypothetical protein TeGR_g2803 [Tetraparma gracilis]
MHRAAALPLPTPPELAALRTALVACSYTTGAVNDLLAIPEPLRQALAPCVLDVPAPPPPSPPTSPLAAVVELFLLGVSVPTDAVEALAPTACAPLLFADSPTTTRARVRITPVTAAEATLHIITDWPAAFFEANRLSSGDELVMYLSPCSLSLLPHLCLLPRPRTALDLCCGSGVLGVFLSTLYPSVHLTALDVSPRALLFTEANLLLNGCRAADSLVCSRLEDYQQKSPVDVLLANPPFVLAPAVARQPLYTSPGNEGVLVSDSLAGGWWEVVEKVL